MFDGDGNTITPKKLQNGFTLRIKKTSLITKAELKKDENFAETNLPPNPSSDAVYSKIYKGVKITANVNDVIEVQIKKDGENPLIVKLKVGKDKNNGNPANNTECVPLKLPQECKAVKDYDNKFGEDVKYYDKRKIVYVYDFNKDPSKREFYKITKDKKTIQLKIEIINFNKETLTSGKNVKFKIFNVNKFMYDVSIADSVIQFDSEPPALFTRLFLGDSTLLGSLIESFSATFSQSSTNSLSNLKSDLNCFIQKYNQLQEKMLSSYDPCYEFPCCYSIEYANLATDLIRIRTAIVNDDERLKSKNPGLDSLLAHFPTDKDLKLLVVYLRNMVVANNSHTSDYISLNGNMLDLTINIASKDSIFKYFSIPEYKINPLEIQIPIIWKPFASFSSGSFIALEKHLQNKTYAWQETIGNNNTASDSSYTLVESGYTLPPMGFCALGNFEWKVTRSFGLGGSLGLDCQ